MDKQSGKKYTAAIAAHTFSFGNHEDLRKPQRCGCFYCLQIFPSDQLREEDCIEEGSGVLTVCCPFCGIDSVIGESSGYQITPELLHKMHEYWFSVSGSLKTQTID